MFVFFAIAGLAYLFYKWVIVNYDYFEKRGIPFSKPVFLFGAHSNTLYNRMSLPEIINKWYNEMKNEKISGMFEFRTPFYLIRDPKLVKQLAVKDFDHFADRRSIIDENVDKMFGKALLSLQGQKWRDMRATLSPMFTGSKMRQMFGCVANVGKQTATTMKQQINAGSTDIFEFNQLTIKFTVDVIASCAFGIEVNSFENPNNDFHRIANILINFTNFKTTLKIIGLMTLPSLMRVLKIKLFSDKIDKFFHEAIHETMKIREENGIIRYDMINLLMQARKGNLSHETKEEEKVEESQVGQPQVKTIWSDDDLAAQAFLFFLGGFDTVATTMSFIGYELTANPDVQAKLYEEIKATEKELHGKTISYEQIQGMKYMDQVVCETLRKWPPTPLADRMCVKDYEGEWDGKKFTIEKGRMFVIPIYGLHKDPKYFPEPSKFDPERFNEENRDNIDPDTYLPFGVGPRSCIGSRFALMELKTVMYYLLLNFKSEVTEKTQIPLKLLQNPFGLKPEKGIWMSLKPRN